MSVARVPTPTSPPPPAPEGSPRNEADTFGSIAHLGELPRGAPAAVGATEPGAPRPSQPPSSEERSRVRIKAVVEEMVVPNRRDYRRE